MIEFVGFTTGFAVGLVIGVVIALIVGYFKVKSYIARLVVKPAETLATVAKDAAVEQLEPIARTAFQRWKASRNGNMLKKP